MTRVDYISYLTGHFSTQSEMDNWIGWARYLDEITPSFDIVQSIIAQASEAYRNGRILDYETYTVLYNMAVGLPYDQDGDPYITNQDYEMGLVDIKIYDAYQGDFQDFSLMLDAGPYLSGVIRATIKAAVESQGGTILSLDIKETTTQKLWNLPLYSNYAVRVFYHGTPAIPAVMMAVIYALSIIGIIVLVWRVTAVMQTQDITKQIVSTNQMNEGLTAIANDPANSETVRKAALDAIKVSQEELTKKLNIQKEADKSANPLANIENIVMYAAIGLGLVLAFKVFQEVRPSIGRR